MSAVPRGKFVWFDCVTTDTKKAIDFYTKLIGWGTQAWEHAPPDNPYTMWVNGETPIGGLMILPDEAKQMGAPPHWLSYISTPNVDETVEAAKDLGGQVYHEPTDIPTVGRFAVLADPQGAVFAVYTPSEYTPGHPGPGEVGEVSWRELMTTDYNAGFEFYRGLFGWEVKGTHDMGEPGIYQMYGRPEDEFPLGGMFNKTEDMPMSAWLYYFRVKDVSKTIEQAKKLGAQILNGPMEVPGGDFIAQCLDPQGAAFALHSTAS